MAAKMAAKMSADNDFCPISITQFRTQSYKQDVVNELNQVWHFNWKLKGFAKEFLLREKSMSYYNTTFHGGIY